MNWEHFYSEERDGWTIDAFAAPEDTDPADLFDDCCAADVEAIREGRLQWFAAKVTASRAGVELGCDYLGGCCYASVRDFLQDGYYDDMVAEAINAARETIAQLVEVTA